MTLPTYDQAFALLDSVFPSHNLDNSGERLHSYSTAIIAEIIASNTPHLNPQKAFIIGLLHDYGKAEQKLTGHFHGLLGYHKMLELGYDEAAQICLTHSFRTKDFNIDDFPSYNRDDIIACHKLIKQLEFDDYDKLIHLADSISKGIGSSTIDDSISYYRIRYKLKPEILNKLESETKALKSYFDQLCNADVDALLSKKA